MSIYIWYSRVVKYKCVCFPLISTKNVTPILIGPDSKLGWDFGLSWDSFRESQLKQNLSRAKNLRFEKNLSWDLAKTWDLSWIRPPEIPQLKSMGNIPFGQFSVTKPQTPNPVILHQFVAAWPYYFWRKIQTFFPNPNFARVRYVRTHATEISQLKLMGNLVFVCISKNKPVNPYPVILYKIVGSPPPHLCQKIRVRRCGRIGRPWHQVAIHASGNPPTKINGKYSFWPILCH